MSFTGLIILLIIIGALYFIIKNLKTFLIIAVLLIAFYIFYHIGTGISTENIGFVINNIIQNITGQQIIENVSSSAIIDNIPNETITGLFHNPLNFFF